MDTGVEGVALLTIFVLSVFTGYEVISKVSTVLHTPLLSGANAIHGVILIGAIIVAGSSAGTVELVVGLIAVTLATVNLVGGFVVTDRMLHMFGKGRPAPASAGGPPAPGGSVGSGRSTGSGLRTALGLRAGSGLTGSGLKGRFGGSAGSKSARKAAGAKSAVKKVGGTASKKSSTKPQGAKQDG